MSLNRTGSILIILIASVFILVIGRNLLIPLVLGFMIWFLIVSIRTTFMKVPIFGKKLPRWLWTSLATITMLVVYIVIINLLINNLSALSQKVPQYYQNFGKLNDWLISNFDVDLYKYEADAISNDEIGKVISGLGKSLSGLFSNLFMIALYVLFLFSEEAVFQGKLRAIFKDEKQHAEIKETLAEISRSIQEYISLKTVVSIITAFASFIALYFIGLDAPIFWAILIFILNYIPTVGSLIATLFPTVIALCQFGDFHHPGMVLGIVGVIQLLVGNVIEPRVMGRSLNLSSLVVILALSFWTAVWGITGAVLSVPIVVVMMIIFKHFKSTEKIARALSSKGELN